MKAKNLLLCSVALLMFTTASQSQTIERRTIRALNIPPAGDPIYSKSVNAPSTQSAGQEASDIKLSMPETPSIFWIWWIKLKDRIDTMQPYKS